MNHLENMEGQFLSTILKNVFEECKILKSFKLETIQSLVIREIEKLTTATKFFNLYFFFSGDGYIPISNAFQKYFQKYQEAGMPHLSEDALNLFYVFVKEQALAEFNYFMEEKAENINKKFSQDCEEASKEIGTSFLESLQKVVDADCIYSFSWGPSYTPEDAVKDLKMSTLDISTEEQNKTPVLGVESSCSLPPSLKENDLLAAVEKSENDVIYTFPGLGNSLVKVMRDGAIILNNSPTDDDWEVYHAQKAMEEYKRAQKTIEEHENARKNTQTHFVNSATCKLNGEILTYEF